VSITGNPRKRERNNSNHLSVTQEKEKKTTATTNIIHTRHPPHTPNAAHTTIKGKMTAAGSSNTATAAMRQEASN
jgi:hypothetical protein